MKACNAASRIRKAEKDVSLSNYRIFETNEFMDCMESLPRKDKVQIEKKLMNYVYPQLIKEPLFGINIKKLHGYTPSMRRYRIGHYRIFYIVEKKMISILSIEQRKDAYK